jgi:hypothetical protein
MTGSAVAPSSTSRSIPLRFSCATMAPPRTVVEPDGTIYQTQPGGARDWSVPPIELQPLPGFGDE